MIRMIEKNVRIEFDSIHRMAPCYKDKRFFAIVIADGDTFVYALDARTRGDLPRCIDQIRQLHAYTGDTVSLVKIVSEVAACIGTVPLVRGN